MTFCKELLPDSEVYFHSRGLNLKGPMSAVWRTTSCEFHGGSDSMRVNTRTGGWCCMSCNVKGGDILSYEMKVSGKEFVVAAQFLGAWREDGKKYLFQNKPSPLSPRQAISVINFEATFVAIAAGNLSNGLALTDEDKRRLFAAANRINRLLEDYL